MYYSAEIAVDHITDHLPFRSIRKQWTGERRRARFSERKGAEKAIFSGNCLHRFVWERIAISLEEAAAYSGIGVRKLRDMTDKPECNYVIWVGNRRMIKRKKFDEYLESAYSV